MLQEVPIPNAICETSCDWCDWQPRGLPPAARRDSKSQPNEAMATTSMGHNRMTARSRREGRGVVKNRSCRNSTHKNPPVFFFLPHTRALGRGGTANSAARSAANRRVESWAVLSNPYEGSLGSRKLKGGPAVKPQNTGRYIGPCPYSSRYRREQRLI